MHLFQQIFFVIVLVSSVWLFARKIMEIRRNILLGRDDTSYSGDKSLRWKNMLLLAFGQKKMFKKPLVALLHFVVYAGFIIVNFEMLEILMDGIFGTHRIFSGIGGMYFLFINSFEWLAAAVIIACAVFLCRRNILKLKRFISHDLDGWPRSDANYILITEIILMSLFLCMNASDTLLQQRMVGDTQHFGMNFQISQYLHPLLNSCSNVTLITIERSCWWLHIIGVLIFLNYLPYSKHLHVLLAFPNAYYVRLQPQGYMHNMPEIQNEVLYAMQPELAPVDVQPPAKFGAKDVTDLSWRNLLDAYSCTECGRCSEVCPANQTGKLLSPRKIMMATRDRMEEVGRNIRLNKTFKEDGKALLNDYISTEELRACTTCNACAEACPVSISPLEIIYELRRSLIMEDSNAPQEWNSMFANIENNFAPWKFPPDDRDAWIHDVK